MDNIEKLRVMLQHWIEHNQGHVEEFEKWRKILADDGKASLAARITEAIKTMATLNAQLGTALHEAGGPAPESEAGHHHHHGGHHHHH